MFKYDKVFGAERWFFDFFFLVIVRIGVCFFSYFLMWRCGFIAIIVAISVLFLVILNRCKIYFTYFEILLCIRSASKSVYHDQENIKFKLSLINLDYGKLPFK